MKTNKPEVKRYEWHHDVELMIEDEGGEFVRFDDYEALQAKYEQLVSYTKNGIKCFANPCSDHSGVNTPPFSEFQERYGQLCLMCVVDERDTLRAECEKLRKDAERYRYMKKGGGWIVAATQTGWHVDGEELDELIDSEMEQ